MFHPGCRQLDRSLKRKHIYSLFSFSVGFTNNPEVPLDSVSNIVNIFNTMTVNVLMITWKQDAEKTSKPLKITL